MSPFRPGEQRGRRPPQQMSDVAIMRFEHIFEVDPKLMSEHVTPAGVPELGHAADRGEPAATTWSGCTATSPPSWFPERSCSDE